MDERRVRHTAGRNADGTTLRVGLTRHCLASGSIQLPFALRDALPEGELLAHDVDRDERLPLRFLRPRTLAGLRPFFQAHELHVNDVLELRLAQDDLRLACVRSARPDREARHTAAPRPAPLARPERPAGGPASQAPHRPTGPARDVVERIGSVTVRRLGASGHVPPPEAQLPPTPVRDPAPADDPVQLADQPARESPAVQPRSHAPSDEAPEPATGDPGRSAEPGASRDAERETRPSAPLATGRAVQSGLFAAHDVDVVVEESDLVDAPGDRSAAPPWPRHGHRPGHRPGQRLREPAADAGRRPPRAAAADGAAARAAGAPPAATAVAERRQREEALSRAGDLRSRIVRFLLDPATPVIVQHELVQQRFELPADVTRDVLAGILESPPPSLRLTVLREGMLRVSRVTVEQEA